jgi:hypothetical protein
VVAARILLGSPNDSIDRTPDMIFRAVFAFAQIKAGSRYTFWLIVRKAFGFLNIVTFGRHIKFWYTYIKALRRPYPQSSTMRQELESKRARLVEMDNPDHNLHQILFDGLNDHGFLFQEKCAEVLSNNRDKIEWLVVTKEYPVSAKVKDTRIDIILRDTRSYAKSVSIYAIIECKRVNPTRTCWLFGNPLIPDFNQPLLISLREQTFPTGRHVDKHIKVGQIRRGPDNIDRFLEYASIKPSLNRLTAYLIDNWWLELGKKQKRYASPQPIEETLTQVCIGVSGIAQEQEEQWEKDAGLNEFSVVLIPIVVTNAPLYVATYDLKDIDLVSGSISADRIYFGPAGQGAEQVDWLLVDYGAGRVLTPDRLYEDVTGTSPAEIEDYHKRSIFVVNAQSMIEFFSRLHLD